jgi:hypothetical protein
VLSFWCSCFCQDQEALAGGLNSLFWEEREWHDATSESDRFYYMPSTGELRVEKPPLVHGGLLCEEMGLGKTVKKYLLMFLS